MHPLTQPDIPDGHEFHDVMRIDRSPRGAKLRRPIYVQRIEESSEADKAIHRYIIEALSWKMARLIPFTLNNTTVRKVAAHLWKHCTGSHATLYQYVYGIHRYSRYLGIAPDTLLASYTNADGHTNVPALRRHARQIDDFVAEMKASHLAPCTIANFVKGVKCLYRVNEIPLTLPYHLKACVKYHDRAPTPEELTKLVDMADIRGKVILTMLALGGFRIGTLVHLQYRHVQRDLERSVLPVHVHVESDITKGKYHDYDTFLGAEATEYLRAYLQMRRRGTRRIPAERIDSESPLIRNERSKTVKPVSPYSIYNIVHGLLKQTHLIATDEKRRYELRPHSLRKYFRTQLGAVNTIPVDFVEYWMGHTISTYNDVRMKGIDYMRSLYASSGLSIRPKTKLTKIQQLKLMIEAWGLNPDEILSRKALTMPHRTVVDPKQGQIDVLNQALKNAIVKELQR